MGKGIHPHIELDVRRQCDALDYAGAAATVVREFGPEIFGFLLATHRSDQDASDVFSDFRSRRFAGCRHFDGTARFEPGCTRSPETHRIIFVATHHVVSVSEGAHR